MLRSLTFALAVLLAACGRPEGPKGPAAPQAACNDVTINPAVSAAPGVATEIAATPGAQAALLGGPIPPGVYDLARVEQRGGAAPLADRIWETVRVSDGEQGQVLDFAIVRGSVTSTPQRYTARIVEGPPARLTHTCGASGSVALSWAAPTGELHLLLPAAGGAGHTFYVFVRRAG